MNQQFIQLYQLLEKGEDCSSILHKLEQTKLTPKEKKSFLSLKLRYLIKNNRMGEVNSIISTNTLMKRDYWLCVEYYYHYNKTKAYQVMNQYIDCIDTNDIDIMISKGFYELIKKWDGFPVTTSNKSNTSNLSMLSKYQFNVSDMIVLYQKKLKSYCKSFEEKIKDFDILIDGANISHLGKEFNFNELIRVVKLVEDMGLKPCIILHERHVITQKKLHKYIVRTPKNHYDDNFLLYGMFRYNKMIISNDLFRDHVIDLDSVIKCHIEMMTIKYIDGKLEIPQYSKCIQVIENSIYIPSVDGFYLIEL